MGLDSWLPAAAPATAAAADGQTSRETAQLFTGLSRQQRHHLDSGHILQLTYLSQLTTVPLLSIVKLPVGVAKLSVCLRRLQHLHHQREPTELKRLKRHRQVAIKFNILYF